MRLTFCLVIFSVCGLLSNAQPYTIPVVFHIVHNGGIVGSGSNLPQVAVMSQLQVMNDDFNRLNADTINTPSAFLPFAADCEITFCLATEDPLGVTLSEPGINRIDRNIEGFDPPPYDYTYMQSTIQPNTIWDNTRYLNVWVTQLSGVIGFSSQPGAPSTTDGIVCDLNSFGTVAATPPYDGGRNITGFVGIYLGLSRIFASSGCTDDGVADTPIQNGPNFGCPTFPSVTCGNAPNGDMFMNFLDYTDDDCMNMFTYGQAAVMWSTLATTRNSLSTSTVCSTAPPVGFTVSSSMLDSKCFASTDGSISLTVSGGSTPYTYNWDNGSTASSIFGLSANNYVVTVADAVGDTVITYTVNQPTAISQTSSTTNPVCGNNTDGSASVDYVGGTTPYSYQWSDGQSSYLATGLAAGNYTLSTTDINSCSITAPITIVALPQPTVSLSVGTQPYCSGDNQGILFSFTGTAPWNFDVTLNGTFNYATSSPIASVPVPDFTIGGNYSVENLIDATGCLGVVLDTVTVVIEQNPIIQSYSWADTTGCLPFTTSFSATVNPPTASIFWDFNDDNQPDEIGNSPFHAFVDAGVFPVNITVSSSAGCTDVISIPQAIEVFETPIAWATSNLQEVEVNSEELNFNAGNVQPGANYEWNFGDGNFSSGVNIQHTYIDTGTFVVVLTASQSGLCEVTDTIIVKVVESTEEYVELANAFSPDGDGVNDFWFIDGIADEVNVTVWIFNRYGDLIVEINDYDNKLNVWDGSNRRGGDAPEGTYFYKIITSSVTTKGWLQLVR